MTGSTIRNVSSSKPVRRGLNVQDSKPYCWKRGIERSPTIWRTDRPMQSYPHGTNAKLGSPAEKRWYFCARAEGFGIARGGRVTLGGEKWLLTGASGQLGRTLAGHWRQCRLPCDVLGVSRRRPELFNYPWACVDLCDPSSLEGLLRATSPTHIFHCAAVARPEEAHSAALSAWLLNRDVTARLSEFAAKTGAWMLYCSSDFVFSGEAAGRLTEDSEPKPSNIYGKTKLAGEKEVLSREAGLVARLSLLYDPPYSTLPVRWGAVRKNLRDHKTLHGVIDEWRTPLTFQGAAMAMTELALHKSRGLFHVGGNEVLSPFDLILRLKAQLRSRSRVIPCARSAFNLPRPANLALDVTRLQRWRAEVDRPHQEVRGQI